MPFWILGPDILFLYKIVVFLLNNVCHLWLHQNWCPCTKISFLFLFFTKSFRMSSQFIISLLLVIAWRLSPVTERVVSIGFISFHLVIVWRLSPVAYIKFSNDFISSVLVIAWRLSLRAVADDKFWNSFYFLCFSYIVKTCFIYFVLVIVWRLSPVTESGFAWWELLLTVHWSQAAPMIRRCACGCRPPVRARWSSESTST